MALPESPWWLVVALLALAGLATFAYAVRALDIGGSVASFLLGLLVAVWGGLGWLLLMVVFTGVGVLATRAGHARKAALGLAERDGERGVANVLGNGAAATLAVLAGLLPGVPQLAAQLAFATALAAVAADTLASELGVLAARARSILPPFRQVRVGTNGGVSLPGQLWAALGAAVLAAAAVPLTGLDPAWAWIPAVAGFLGCQLDSLLGALWEREVHPEPVQKAEQPGRVGVSAHGHASAAGIGATSRGDGHRWLSKQGVNFLASALPALAVLLGVAGWH